VLSTGILQKRIELQKNCGIVRKKREQHIAGTAAELHAFLRRAELLSANGTEEEQSSEILLP
jgi:hypothetical protein